MPTHPADRPAYLSAAGLMLDVRGLMLTGPAGTVQLERGPYTVLKMIMTRPGIIVPVGDLVSISWPDPMLEPTDAERAVRARVARARAAMKQVGVPASHLRCIRELGYQLTGAPLVVRTFTPHQAAAVDAWARTHPAFQSEAHQ